MIQRKKENEPDSISKKVYLSYSKGRFVHYPKTNNSVLIKTGSLRFQNKISGKICNSSTCYKEMTSFSEEEQKNRYIAQIPCDNPETANEEYISKNLKSALVFRVFDMMKSNHSKAQSGDFWKFPIDGIAYDYRLLEYIIEKGINDISEFESFRIKDIRALYGEKIEKKEVVKMNKEEKIKNVSSLVENTTKIWPTATGINIQSKLDPNKQLFFEIGSVEKSKLSVAGIDVSTLKTENPWQDFSGKKISSKWKYYNFVSEKEFDEIVIKCFK